MTQGIPLPKFNYNSTLGFLGALALILLGGCQTTKNRIKAQDEYNQSMAILYFDHDNRIKELEAEVITLKLLHHIITGPFEKKERIYLPNLKKEPKNEE